MIAEYAYLETMRRRLFVQPTQYWQIGDPRTHLITKKRPLLFSLIHTLFLKNIKNPKKMSDDWGTLFVLLLTHIQLTFLIQRDPHLKRSNNPNLHLLRILNK